MNNMAAGLKYLMYLVLASLTGLLVSYHMVNNSAKSDEDARLYSPLSTRDLPKALRTFLNSSLPPFLHDYKNPCWYNGPRLNCLPYFHLIGVTKCGTTSLCTLMNEHPQLVQVQKENHWISHKQFLGAALAPLSAYTELFKNGTKEIQRSLVSGFHPKVFGDCTPSTLFKNEFHRLVPRANSPLILQEPIFTNAEYIHHLNPAAKLLVIIRNPVDRLFSEYMFLQRSFYSLEVFDTLARELVLQIRKCLEKSSLHACAFEEKVGRIRRGIYHIHLKDVFAVFPRNQVMVVKMEDFSKDMANTMSEVYSFLDLEPMSDAELKASVKEVVERPRNQRKPERQKLGKMWNSTRQLLYDFYKPYNEGLVKLLGPKFDYN